MSNIFRDYEEKFKKPVPMPEQIEESIVSKVAADHLEKNTPIPEDFDWWEMLPRNAFA